MTERTAADRKAWNLVKAEVLPAYVGRTDRDDAYDREEDRAEEERVTWAEYGETQELPDGDEPPTEGWLA